MSHTAPVSFDRHTDRALRLCEAAYLRDPREDDDLAAEADEARARLIALEDAGCDVVPCGRLWTVSLDGVLLGSGASLDAAVVDAFPVAVARGVVS